MDCLERVRGGEDLSEVAHLARSGQVVAERLERAGLGSELVVDGGTGDIGPLSHRVQGERGVAGGLGEKSPGSVDHPAASLVDLRLASSELVGAGAHRVLTAPSCSAQIG